MGRQTTSPTRVKAASASELRRDLARRRELAEMDMISRLQGSWDEGFAEGQAEVQTEVAHRMLQMKMSLSDIVAATAPWQKNMS